MQLHRRSDTPGFYLAAGHIIMLFLLQSLNLGFGENDAISGHFGLQCLQPVLEVGQIVTQPDGAHTGR